MRRILFYSRVKNRKLFDSVGFYAVDIELLRELGYEVFTTNRLRDVFYTAIFILGVH